MQKKLQANEKMLLELLRAAISAITPTISLFDSATEADWKACYRLAGQQGVTSTAWDGVLSLPSSIRPPLAVKLNWALTVEKQEKVYEKYVKTVCELSELFSQHDIASVQLKGTGLSSYYPIPAHREGGDIDMYAFSADSSKFSDHEANLRSDCLIEEMGIEVDRRDHKNSFFYFKGIPVENHNCFLEKESIHSFAKHDAYLRTLLNPEEVTLLDGKYKLHVPSPEFNTLFLAFHAIQHYGNGLCLHHFCDWACLINKYGLHIPPGMQDKHVINFINQLTVFTNRYLGTNADASCSEQLLNKMMIETLRPPYTKNYGDKGKVGQLIYKTKRFWHYLNLRHEVLGESRLNGIWHSISYHIRKPQAIFYHK